MNKISAVILTKNVEDKIEKCINSLEFVDEIIVIDDSDDKTAEVAKKFPKVKIFKRTFDDYSSQRNFGIETAANDWILMLDSDEETESGFAQSVNKAIESSNFAAFKFPRKNLIFGKFMEYSGWYPDYQTRLFRKGKAKYERLVHEKLTVEGEIGSLPVHIIHYNYETVSQYLEKLQKYTTLEASELVSSGYKFCWKDLLLKTNSEILRRFFAESGYKDGLHGLSLSILQGFYTFVTYLKVWEEEKFAPKEKILIETNELKKEIELEWDFWFQKTLPHNVIKKIWKKLRWLF